LSCSFCAVSFEQFATFPHLSLISVYFMPDEYLTESKRAILVNSRTSQGRCHRPPSHRAARLGPHQGGSDHECLADRVSLLHCFVHDRVGQRNSWSFVQVVRVDEWTGRFGQVLCMLRLFDVLNIRRCFRTKALRFAPRDLIRTRLQQSLGVDSSAVFTSPGRLDLVQTRKQ
jgi:hypothetical protein